MPGSRDSASACRGLLESERKSIWAPCPALHRSRRRSPKRLSWPQGLRPTFAGRALVSAPIHGSGVAAGGNKGASEAGGSKGENVPVSTARPSTTGALWLLIGRSLFLGQGVRTLPCSHGAARLAHWQVVLHPHRGRVVSSSLCMSPSSWWCRWAKSTGYYQRCFSRSTVFTGIG